MGGVLNSLVNFIFDRMHPIGSFYISDDNKNPETIFGGTWQKITDRFLYASGSKPVGNVGGEESHILIEAEMPAHVGHLAGNSGSLDYTQPNNYYLPETVFKRYGDNSRGWVNFNAGEMQPEGKTRGQNVPHNNMPPYQVVNIWKRIA